MQGHSGSVVCRQAAEHLTLLWFSQWRTEAALGEVAERHTKLIVKFLCTDTFLKITEGIRRFATDCFSVGQCLDIYFLQMKFEENIEINNLFLHVLTSVSSWIHSFKSLSILEASVCV